MTPNTLLQVGHDTHQLLIDTAAAHQREGPHPQRTRVVLHFLRACLEIPDAVQEDIQTIWRQAADKQLDNYQEAGEQVRTCLDELLVLWDQLRRGVEQLQRLGIAVEGVEELAGSGEKLQRLRQDFVNRWPWIDATIIQEARAEYSRGEFQTIEEILDELQGKDS